LGTKVTRQTHDQFAKSLLSEFLEPWGSVEVSREVSDEPRSIDLYFEPDPQRPPQVLGLLGRLATLPCLLEPYRNPVSIEQIRACILKSLMVQAQHQRSESVTELPRLWILTPTASKKVLKQFGALPEDPWPKGIYLLPSGLRGGVVVIHQLPKTRETLWLRLLGRGKIQQQAIQEVLDMSSEDPDRIRVLELLGNWKIMLDESREALRQEERELVMNLSPAYLKWKEETLNEGIQIGERRGKEEGKEEAKVEVALKMLAAGMDLSQIAQLTELTLDQIRQLQTE
jgi:hypothetical protein